MQRDGSESLPHHYAREPASLYRLAGYSTFLAVATMVVAGVALALFFSGAGSVFGPINDAFTALTLLLLLPAVQALRVLASAATGGWFDFLSLLTALGLLLVAAGSVLLIVGLIDLATSFVTFGLGLLPFLAWVVAVAYLALGPEVVARPVGWTIVAFLAAVVLAMAALPFMSMSTISLTAAPLIFATLAGWLILLGRDMLRRAQ